MCIGFFLYNWRSIKQKAVKLWARGDNGNPEFSIFPLSLSIMDKIILFKWLFENQLFPFSIFKNCSVTITYFWHLNILVFFIPIDVIDIGRILTIEYVEKFKINMQASFLHIIVSVVVPDQFVGQNGRIPVGYHYLPSFMGYVYFCDDFF